MNFSIKEAFSFSFKVLKENLINLLSISLFSIILVNILIYLMSKILLGQFDFSYIMSVSNMAQWILFKNITLLFISFLLVCLTNTILPVFDGLKIDLKKYFLNVEKTINFVCGMFLILLIPSILSLSYLRIFPKLNNGGAIFSCFQALYVVLFFYVIVYLCKYALFYIDVLKGQSVLVSLKNSARMLNENLYKFVALMVILYLINVLGVISIIGSIFVLPFNVLVLSHVYMQLVNNGNDVLQKTNKKAHKNKLN